MSGPVTFHDADYADGPLLAAWLRSQPTYSTLVDPGAARRVSAWSCGERAPFEVVDRVLIALGFHVADVPDECWRKGNPRSRRPENVDWGRRRKAVATYERTASLREAAAAVGVSSRTVRRWIGQPLEPVA